MAATSVLLLLGTSCSGILSDAADSPTSVSTPTTAPTTSTAADQITTTLPPSTGSTLTDSTLATSTTGTQTEIQTGAQVLASGDGPDLGGLRIGLIVNQTATIDSGHLVDFMAESPGYNLVAVFGPEHGFRGTGDAGELTSDSVDPATGIPIFSLYGNTRKPTPEMLAGIDVLVYDIVDVGTRFYTFISTMGLAMQAAAEAGIEFVVLDRPNPNPSPISGFVRTPDQDSFISQYPIPSVYGLTAGELATMIVSEAWLPGLGTLELSVVPVSGWSRSTPWLEGSWVAPSPGLPTLETARSYPGLVLFEATTMSLGRGTPAPFTMVGAPWLDTDEAVERMAAIQDSPTFFGLGIEATSFTPERYDYMTADPIFVGQDLPAVRMTIESYSTGADSVAGGVLLLVEMQRQATAAGVELIDRPATFDLLAGTTQLRTMLLAGASADEIVQAWQSEVADFSALTNAYRLYPD